MKRTAKHYKTMLDNYRVALKKQKQENEYLRSYVLILHEAITDKAFVTFLRMREEVHGKGNLRVSIVGAEDAEILVLNSMVMNESLCSAVSVGWIEKSDNDKFQQVDTFYIHTMEGKRLLSFNSHHYSKEWSPPGAQKKTRAFGISTRKDKLEVTYGKDSNA